MYRTNKRDLEQVVANLNRRLPEGVEIHVEYRYGYVALDEYHAHGARCVRTVATGMTKREAYDAAWHMIRGIDLANTKEQTP